MEVLVYAIAGLFGILLRVGIGFTQGCLYVGRAISDANTRTGLQNAVTPPCLTNFIIIISLSCAALICLSIYKFGLGSALFISAEMLVIVPVVDGVFVPKPDAAIWTKKIYRSLTQRSANYAKRNDLMRSEAAIDLARLIEERLTEKIRM